MKKILIIASLLILSVGFSQQLIPVVETYSDGNIKSITYHKKSRTEIEKVKYEEYYDNGQKSLEETWKGRYQDGLFTGWYENGKKKGEETYKDGKRDGKYTRWYENGQKEEEATIKNGNPDGPFASWYENGQKEKEGIYKGVDRWNQPQKIGKWTGWHENGQMSSEATYKDGKSDGPYASWHENGQMASRGTYKDGKKDGLYTEWYDNGQKRFEYTLKDGELISEECWDENGDNHNCYTSGDMAYISLKQAKKFFDEGVVFVDTRGDKYFADGHIQNAWNSVFFMELMFKLDSAQTKSGLVVLYCGEDECGSSEELAYDLYDEGFTKLFVFKGGWQEWNEAGYPVE